MNGECRIEDMPYYELERQDDLNHLKECLEQLDERERIIVLERFSDNPKTFEKISDDYSIHRTHGRINQIYRNAMWKLETMMDSDSRISSEPYFEFNRINAFKRHKKGKKRMDWFEFKNKKSIKGKMDEGMMLYLYKEHYR